MYKELQKRYNKLIWTIGIGEIFVSFTTIVDMIAVSMLGIASLAGYALATNFIGALYLCYDAINTFSYAEYANKKDTKVLDITFKLGFLAQIITLSIVIFATFISLKVSGLSNEANNVALLIIIGRGFGSIFFNMTTSYYTYYRSEGKESIATTSRLIASFLNIILDIVSIVQHWGILGILGATIISELVEFLFLKIYSVAKGIKFNKATLKEVLSYTKLLLEGYGVETSMRITVIAVGLAASRLGDEKYAVYGIIQVVCGQLMWFVYSNDMIVGILYGEFKNKYESIKKLFYDNLKVVIKSMCIYSVIASMIIPVLLHMITYKNEVKVSIVYLTMIVIFWIVIETYFSILSGYIYIFDKYNIKIKGELVGGILAFIITFICTFTNNPYITYMIGWIVDFGIIGIKEYKGIQEIIKVNT